VEAIVKREDGIVIVDNEKCNGCGLCVYACPYGAMSFNELTKVVGKCNLCLERLEYGIEPSCVQHCIGGALRYVTQEDLEETIKGKHTSFIGKVCYASSKWKLAQ
jgi:Fe-S-cluster-containing dehydrogenase component